MNLGTHRKGVFVCVVVLSVKTCVDLCSGLVDLCRRWPLGLSHSCDSSGGMSYQVADEQDWVAGLLQL